MASVHADVLSARGDISFARARSAQRSFSSAGDSRSRSSSPRVVVVVVLASDRSAAHTCTAFSRPQCLLTRSFSVSGSPARESAASHRAPEEHSHAPVTPPETSFLPRGLRGFEPGAPPPAGAQHDAMSRDACSGARGRVRRIRLLHLLSPPPPPLRRSVAAHVHPSALLPNPNPCPNFPKKFAPSSAAYAETSLASPKRSNPAAVQSTPPAPAPPAPARARPPRNDGNDTGRYENRGGSAPPPPPPPSPPEPTRAVSIDESSLPPPPPTPRANRPNNAETRRLHDDALRVKNDSYVAQSIGSSVEDNASVALAAIARASDAARVAHAYCAPPPPPPPPPRSSAPTKTRVIVMTSNSAWIVHFSPIPPAFVVFTNASYACAHSRAHAAPSACVAAEGRRCPPTRVASSAAARIASSTRGEGCDGSLSVMSPPASATVSSSHSAGSSAEVMVSSEASDRETAAPMSAATRTAHVLNPRSRAARSAAVASASCSCAAVDSFGAFPYFPPARLPSAPDTNRRDVSSPTSHASRGASIVASSGAASVAIACAV
eukprot:30655-Pelagococcus_subviridis.AAC.7